MSKIYVSALACVTVLATAPQLTFADQLVASSAEAPDGCDRDRLAAEIPRICRHMNNEDWWKALGALERTNQPRCPYNACFRATLTAKLVAGAKTFRETEQVVQDYRNCQNTSTTSPSLSMIKRQAEATAGPLVANFLNEQRARRLKITGGVLLGIGGASLVLSVVGAAYEKSLNGVLLCDGGGFMYNCTDRFRAAYGTGFALSAVFLIGGALLVGTANRNRQPAAISLVPTAAESSPSESDPCQQFGKESPSCG